MSRLGREAADLVRAGREALQPSHADRERIALALRARVGPPPKPPSLDPRGFGWQALSAVVVGLGAVGLIASGVLRKEPAAPPVVAPPAVAVAPAAPPGVPAVPAPPVVAAPESSEVAVAAVVPARTSNVMREKPRATPRPSDRLAEEVELLSRAQRDLNARQFASALRLFDEHARSFPSGTLAPERRSARIQALCGLGRMTEARAELARLTQGSLYAARAREACALRSPDATAAKQP